ncbi:MAG: hypothetical protein WDN76_09090 [Alphaproteobacteria bacterium]
MKTASAGFVAALALSGAFVAGCTPVRETHGWVSDTASEAQVQPGVDTRSTVMARMDRLRPPAVSARAIGITSPRFRNSSLISSQNHRPDRNRRPIQCRRRGRQVDKFGIERGRVINYSGDKTPTRGRELGILEQIFGTVGAKLPTDREAEADRRR